MNTCECHDAKQMRVIFRAVGCPCGFSRRTGVWQSRVSAMRSAIVAAACDRPRERLGVSPSRLIVARSAGSNVGLHVSQGEGCSFHSWARLDTMSVPAPPMTGRARSQSVRSQGKAERSDSWRDHVSGTCCGRALLNRKPIGITDQTVSQAFAEWQGSGMPSPKSSRSAVSPARRI
jgi:hypothetical protein